MEAMLTIRARADAALWSSHLASGKKGGSESSPSSSPAAATEYAKILALRTLRWKIAKRMAPIALRMHADAKMLLALKKEMGKAVKGVWGDDDAQCSMDFDRRGTIEEQLEIWGEVETAGIEDIKTSLAYIRHEAEKAAAALGKVPNEPRTMEEFEKEHAEEAAALQLAAAEHRETDDDDE